MNRVARNSRSLLLKLQILFLPCLLSKCTLDRRMLQVDRGISGRQKEMRAAAAESKVRHSSRKGSWCPRCSWKTCPRVVARLAAASAASCTPGQHLSWAALQLRSHTLTQHTRVCTHTITHTHTLTHTHSHTQSPTLTIRTHTHIHIVTNSHADTHTQSQIHTLTHIHPASHTLTLRQLTHTHSQTHTDSHTYTPTLSRTLTQLCLSPHSQSG